jgi:hypothetical protein
MAIAARSLKGRMARKGAALEFSCVAAGAVGRSPEKDGRIPDVTLPTSGERVLTVERERVLEASRCPTSIVVAATALFRIQIHVQGRFGGFVVGPMTSNAVGRFDLQMRRFEIFGALAAGYPHHAGCPGDEQAEPEA